MTKYEQIKRYYSRHASVGVHDGRTCADDWTPTEAMPVKQEPPQQPQTFSIEDAANVRKRGWSAVWLGRCRE